MRSHVIVSSQLGFGVEGASLQIRGICEKWLIDRCQGEFGTLLRQQHLSGAGAENTISRKPRQTE